MPKQRREGLAIPADSNGFDQPGPSGGIRRLIVGSFTQHAARALPITDGSATAVPDRAGPDQTDDPGNMSSGGLHASGTPPGRGWITAGDPTRNIRRFVP
ncbi:hypothetical protein BraRD5C2_03450 [Bradyrhizobium sp. RD5-C2]|nr:hypothetical protein BraRD5C2_03450 [Bradyrhizobium sp. RD5-C2]